MYESNIATLELAIVFFIAAFVLSVISLKYKKPEGRWFSPVWKMADNYERPGIVLYAIAMGLMVIGFILYFIGRV